MNRSWKRSGSVLLGVGLLGLATIGISYMVEGRVVFVVGAIVVLVAGTSLFLRGILGK